MKLGHFKPWAQWVIGGVLLLSILELILVAIVFPELKRTLFDWQTLVAGVLALIGAGATVYYIHLQIKQVEYLEVARRSREEMAARAVLPLAFSQIVKYAVDCIKQIEEHSSRPGGRAGNPIPDGMVAVSVTDDVVGVLQQCARYADAEVVTQIATFLAGFRCNRRDTGI